MPVLIAATFPRMRAWNLSSLEFQAWRTVLLDDPCVYCGGVPTGLDHLVPRAAGGANGMENRAPACAPCDNAKGATSLLAFLVSRRQRSVGGGRVRSVAERDEADQYRRELIAEAFYRGNVRWAS